MQDHATAEKTADARLAESLTAIALTACAAILKVDFRNAGTRHKADTSPVTLADEAAQAAILQGLARLLPDVPVASEEAACQWGIGFAHPATPSVHHVLAGVERCSVDELAVFAGEDLFVPNREMAVP